MKDTSVRMKRKIIPITIVVLVFSAIVCIMFRMFYIRQNAGVVLLTDFNSSHYSKIAGRDITAFISRNSKDSKLDQFDIKKLNMLEDDIKWVNILSLHSEDEMRELPSLYLKDKACLLFADKNQEFWNEDMQYLSAVKIEFEVICTDGKEKPIRLTTGEWQDDRLKIVKLVADHLYRIEADRHMITLPTDVDDKCYYAIINQTGQDLILVNGTFCFPMN